MRAEPAALNGHGCLRLRPWRCAHGRRLRFRGKPVGSSATRLAIQNTLCNLCDVDSESFQCRWMPQIAGASVLRTSSPEVGRPHLAEVKASKVGDRFSVTDGGRPDHGPGRRCPTSRSSVGACLERPGRVSTELDPEAGMCAHGGSLPVLGGLPLVRMQSAPGLVGLSSRVHDTPRTAASELGRQPSRG